MSSWNWPALNRASSTPGLNANLRSAVAWLQKKPITVFALFFAAWALYGSITSSDMSLHQDMLEAYAWGREFRLGYNQHGPFWAWNAGFWFLVFPNTNTSFILLAVLNATIGLWGAWRLIGLFAQGRQRDTAALLLLATPFYTFLSFKYNANTIFLSLWLWTLFFFVRSLDTMRRLDAFFFGILSAASILSKYFAIVLLLTCAGSLLVHDNRQKYVLSAQPYIAAASFFMVVLPHLIWSIAGGAPPVAYALSLTGKGWLFSIRDSADFLVKAALYHVVVLIIILLSRYAYRTERVGLRINPATPSRQRFLAALVLGPPLLTVVFGICFQLDISTNMTVGTFPLMPLFMVQRAAPLDKERLFRLSAGFAITVTVAALVAAPFVTKIMATSRDLMRLEPRKELAVQVTRLWRAETNTPLRFAGGGVRYANGISFYSADRPSSFIDLSYAKAPWVTGKNCGATAC
jgi:hypothetical protein